jgi:hypothetical protein
VRFTGATDRAGQNESSGTVEQDPDVSGATQEPVLVVSNPATPVSEGIVECTRDSGRQFLSQT